MAGYIGVMASTMSNREQVPFELFRKLNCDANFIFRDDMVDSLDKATPSEMDMIKNTAV